MTKTNNPSNFLLFKWSVVRLQSKEEKLSKKKRDGVCVQCVINAGKEYESPAGQTLTICLSSQVPTTQLPHGILMNLLS